MTRSASDGLDPEPQHRDTDRRFRVNIRSFSSHMCLPRNRGFRAPTRSLLTALAALVVWVSSLAFSESASAYNLLGPRWWNEPTSGCCGTFYVQFNTFTNWWSNGIGAWNGYHSWSNYDNSAINANWYLVDSSVATAQDTYNSAVSWDGLTSLSWDANNYFTYADLYLNSYFTNSYSQTTIDGVASHEIGHQLGLDHETGCVLMVADTASRTSCSISAPTTDDIDGVNALY